jgi:hypothetical protein
MRIKIYFLSRFLYRITEIPIRRKRYTYVGGGIFSLIVIKILALIIFDIGVLLALKGLLVIYY